MTATYLATTPIGGLEYNVRVVVRDDGAEVSFWGPLMDDWSDPVRLSRQYAHRRDDHPAGDTLRALLDGNAHLPGPDDQPLPLPGLP
jgi:hypothetical protein